MARPAFAVVPVEAFGDGRLGARDMRVLGVLYAHSNEEGVCWPSRRCLAEMTGVDQRHIKRALNRLQQFGWVVVLPGSGRGRLTQYCLTVAPLEMGADSAPDRDERRGADSGGKGGRFVPKRGLVRAEKGAGTGHVEHTRNRSGTDQEQDAPRMDGGQGEQALGELCPSPPAPPSPRRAASGASTSSVDLPPWLPEATWAEFLEHRRKLKAPMTDVAQRRAIAELGRLREVGHDADAVLGQSIVNGWKGLFPLKSTAAPAFERRRMDGTLTALQSLFGDEDHGQDDVSAGHGLSGGRVRCGADEGAGGCLPGPTGRSSR